MTTTQEDAVRIGANLRRLRKGQGMSLDLLAGAAGLSKSFLSRVERGERHLERRSHLESIARALSCSIADLIGQPFPAIGRTQDLAHAAVPSLRRVLHSAAIGFVAPGDALPIEDLADRSARLWDLRRRCDYAGVARALPGLLEALFVAVDRGPDKPRALRLLVEVSSAAAFALRSLGYADLAWTAAAQCHAAASELGDPFAVGFADFTRAQASSLGPGYDGALRLAEDAADQLRPYLNGSTEDERVYGTLLLTAAWAAAATRNYGQVDTFVSEAVEIGARTGHADPAGDPWQTYFGPSNTGIWRMGIAVETGNGGQVREIAEGVDLGVIDSDSRRASYWVEMGRGLAQEAGKETEAADAFLRADAVAPQRTRSNPVVRATVGTMLDRVTQRAAGRKLSTLVSRMDSPK
jgi:transcriptional regulator with XRE-family HTH domain